MRRKKLRFPACRAGECKFFTSFHRNWQPYFSPSVYVLLYDCRCPGFKVTVPGKARHRPPILQILVNVDKEILFAKNLLIAELMFAKRDKHYPSRSGPTSQAAAVTNFTKPVTKINSVPST